MRTFGELLSEYMTRTGISDSELSRTLGVRRQTIFRWKEGLVEKPRHREDVLRCAARLRLTPKELDELLLAAGFSPENVQVSTPVSISPRIEPEEPHSIQITESAPVVFKPKSSPRHFRRPVFLSIVACFLLVLAGGFLLLMLRQSDSKVYPVASPGETLIVIGSFDGAAKPTGDSRSSTIKTSDRMRDALDREVRAARLDRVRVEIWPEEIRDYKAGESVRQRSGSSLVIGGTQAVGGAVTILMVSSNPSRPDDVALDALIALPSNLQMQASATSSEEIQTLALFNLAQLYIQEGDLGKAHAALTLALERPPVDKDTLAILYIYLGYTYQVSKPPELTQAVTSYGKAIELSDVPLAYLNRGLAQVRLNQALLWQSDFSHVLAVQSNDLNVHQALCWAYAIDKQPELALPHCDAAATRGAVGFNRQAHAVVYAELGRLKDAAVELQGFMEWLGKQNQDLRAHFGTTPADWSEAMKSGHNPFDEATLEKMRRN